MPGGWPRSSSTPPRSPPAAGRGTSGWTPVSHGRKGAGPFPPPLAATARTGTGGRCWPPGRADARGRRGPERRDSARRRLVEGQPVDPELADRLREDREVHGLAHVAVGAQVVALDDVALLARRAEDDDGDAAGVLVLAKDLQHLQAIDSGPLQVVEEQPRQPLAVTGAPRLVAEGQRLGA